MYSGLLHNPQPSLLQPPTAMDLGLSTSAPSRANHPNISFWTQGEWTSHKAHTQQAEIITSDDQDATPLDFIESLDGIPVSPERIKAIRRSARELFVSLKASWELNGRKVPGSWGGMSHGNKEFYRQKMKAQFPELAFCELDWKCEWVATQTYPGWYRNHGGEAKVKREPGVKQRRLKKAAGSSTSSTPSPDNVPGQSNPSGPEQSYLPPTLVNPSISIPTTNSHPNLSHLLPTSVSIASPATPVLGLRLDPLDLGTPIPQGLTHSKIAGASQDPNINWSPTPLPEFQSSQSFDPESQSLDLDFSVASPGPIPPIPTDTRLSATSQSPDILTLPPVEAVAPTNPIRPLENETVPAPTIQVCLRLLDIPHSPLNVRPGI